MFIVMRQRLKWNTPRQSLSYVENPRVVEVKAVRGSINPTPSVPMYDHHAINTTGHINNNDTGLIVHLFLDRMHKLKHFYLLLISLYKSSHLSFKVLPPDGTAVSANGHRESAQFASLCWKKGTLYSGWWSWGRGGWHSTRGRLRSTWLRQVNKTCVQQLVFKCYEAKKPCQIYKYSRDINDVFITDMTCIWLASWHEIDV